MHHRLHSSKLVSLSILPEEILLYIFSYASTTTLIQLSTTCKIFQALLPDAYFQKRTSHIKNMDYDFGNADLTWMKLSYCQEAPYLVIGTGYRLDDIADQLCDNGITNVTVWESRDEEDGQTIYIPTIDELKSFKAILVFSDWSMLGEQAEELGDVLVEYIEQSYGGIVTMLFSSCNNVDGACLSGKFSKYHPLHYDIQVRCCKLYH
jgi:hypothetical protein